MTEFVDGRRQVGSFAPWPAALAGDGPARWLDEARIEFVAAAEWRWEEGRSVPRRRLPTASLAWLAAGAGQLRADGVARRLDSPCLHLIPAGVWHDARHDPGRPFAGIGVHFQAPLPGGGDLLDLLGLPTVLRLAPDGLDAPLVAALRQLARLDARRPPGWRLLAQAELVRALMHVVLEHGGACRPVAQPSQPTARLPARLAPVFALIERDLPDGPLPVAGLAALAGVSAVHLRTLFRRTTGQSPHRYIQERRIARACRLLRADAAPLASVAAAVGVPDLRVFHRLFRQLTGTTPARWRSEL